MEPGARHRSDRTKSLVGFLVGDVRYAVDILRVREVVNPLAIVGLPHAPPVVVGVADHRGEVIPIIDLRRRFGLVPADDPKKSKWIIVRIGRRAAGLIVDAVTDVFGTGGDDQREVPQLGAGDAARGISAVYAHEGTLVFVVDVDRLAAAAEMVDLDAHRAMDESALSRSSSGGGKR